MSASANVVASQPPEPSDRLPRLRYGRLRAETDASARISSCSPSLAVSGPTADGCAEKAVNLRRLPAS